MISYITIIGCRTLSRFVNLFKKDANHLNFKCKLHCDIRKLQKPAYGEEIRRDIKYNVLNYNNSIHHENNYYHDLLKSNALYANSIAFQKSYPKYEGSVNTILDKNFESETIYILKDYFKDLLTVNSEEIIKDDRFINLCKALIANIQHLDNDRIIELLNIMLLWPSDQKDDTFYELGQCLDALCLERYKSWTIEKLLLAMDHFYRLGYRRYSNFFWEGLRRLCSKIDGLTCKQLVQMMFYANVSRKWPQIKTYRIEYALDQCIDELSIDEVSLISLAFFKTSVRITNPELVQKIYSKLMYRMNMKPLNSVTLCSLFKLFRFSTPLDLKDRMTSLMYQLLDKTDNLEIPSAVQAALLGTTLHVFHPELLNKLSQRFVSQIQEARLKDIERLILSLAMFNFNPNTNPCVFQAALHELKNPNRISEIQSYPREFVLTLSNLSLINIYDYELLNQVFSEEFLTRTYGRRLNKYKLPREILHLANSILIECSDYRGNQLDPELRSSLSTSVAFRIPHSKGKTFFDQMFRDVKLFLIKYFNGPDYVHSSYVLPHIPHPNLIFCIRDNVVQKIPESMRQTTFVDMICPPANIGSWYCVTFVVRNNAIELSQEALGICHVAHRQLKRLNYNPITVHFSEWCNLRHDIHKEQYIRDLINNVT